MANTTDDTSEKRSTRYAWFRYYEALNEGLGQANTIYNTNSQIVVDPQIPTHIKNQLIEMSEALKRKWECPVCLDMIATDCLSVTNCGHYYCKTCLENLKQFSKRQSKPKWECATCRKKHSY